MEGGKLMQCVAMVCIGLWYFYGYPGDPVAAVLALLACAIVLLAGK